MSAPEKIWVEDFGPIVRVFDEPVADSDAYIRADIHEALQEEVKRLREALQPFADALEMTNQDFGIDVSEHYETANMVSQPYIRMNHFAKARAALEESKVENTE